MNYPKKRSKPNRINVNHLVRLGDSEREVSVFCIHPSGGDVGVYRKLGRQLRKHTTIGLQSRMNFGPQAEYNDVTEMAEVYANLINQYQPTGPIRLLGFSFGGFIANAIVGQLKALHREVGFFGLIDSDLRWVFDKAAVRGDLTERLEQISLNLRKAGLLNPMPPAKVKSDIGVIVDLCLAGLAPDRVAGEIEARGHTARTEADTLKFRNFVVRFASHCRLILTFRPAVMEVPIHMWWPSEGDDQRKSRSQHWRDFALSDIFESTIEGSHYSIMKMPCVKKLAAEVSAALVESESPTAQTFDPPTL